MIDRPVAVREGKASVAAYPGEPDRLVLSYQLDYGPEAPIPPQSYFAEPDPDRFLAEIAPARTFLLAAEAEALRAAGVGRRTSEADLLIFGPDGPINNRLALPRRVRPAQAARRGRRPRPDRQGPGRPRRRPPIRATP